MYIQFFTAFTNPFALQDGKSLIGPLLVILLITLIWLFAVFCALKLSTQYSAARKLLLRLEKEPEMISRDDIRLAGFAISKTTKGSLARAVRALTTCKSPAEVRELVSQVAVREESRGAAVFLNFAVGSVLILGLMGTFIAFAELVASSDLGGDAFQQGIKSVLEHLNLAFYASIAGVGASITLLLFSTVWIRPKRQLLLADLEDLLVNSHLESVRTALNAMDGTESGDLFETLRKLSANLSQAVESIRTVAVRFENLSLSTPEAMAGTLEAVRQEIADSSSRYAELVSTATATKEAVQGISGEAAKVLGEMLKEHGGRQLEVYAQAQEFSRKLLIEIGDKDAERLKAYRDGISGVAEKVATLAVGWQSHSLELASAFQKERNGFVIHFNEVAENWAASLASASNGSLEAVKQISANMAELCGNVASEAVARLETAYQAQISGWTQSAEIAKQQNRTMKETLGILDKRLEPLATSLHELLTGARNTLVEAGNAASRIAEVPTQLDRMIDSHAEGIGNLSAEASNMSKTVRNLGADANGVFQKVDAKLTRLSKQLDNLIEIGKQSGYDLDAPKSRKFITWAKGLFSRK